MLEKKLREIDLSITGYAICCSNKTANKAVNTEEILNTFEHRSEIDLTEDGNKAVEFLSNRHNFTGDVFVVLRNFADADEEIKEHVSKKVKTYHENHFFTSNIRSLLLITETDYELSRHDSTLRGRVKYINN